MRLVLALAVAIAACGGEAARSSPTASSASQATSSAIPSIDVSDMMGAFPPTTYFVVRPGNVTALALLNHATKYTIPIAAEGAQVTTATQAGRVYVLDQTREGARLRWFEIASGAEVRTQLIPGASVVATGSGHGTLAFDSSNGEVFALLREGSTMAIEEFEGFTLSPVKRRLGDLRCGDRILAGAGRVVLACMAEGGLVVDASAGGGKFSARTPLVAIAMSVNGTLMAGSADGRLFKLAPAAVDLETIDTLRDEGIRLLSDGLAAQADGVPSGGNHAVNDNLALRWHEHSIDEPKKRCLSGTAAAEKNESFAGGDPQRHVRDDRATVHPVRDPAKFDGCRVKRHGGSKFRIHFD